MNRTQQDYLFRSFPELFDDANDAPIKQWGIEVQDGWYAIIAQMCSDFDDLRRTRQSALPKIRQIKSKYGQLTVYLSATDEAVDTIIGAAIENAKHTCEICGAPGTLRRTKNRWYFVACRQHAEGAEPVNKS